MYRIVALYNNKNVYFVSKTTDADADADDDAVMLHVVSVAFNSKTCFGFLR